MGTVSDVEAALNSAIQAAQQAAEAAINLGTEEADRTVQLLITLIDTASGVLKNVTGSV